MAFTSNLNISFGASSTPIIRGLEPAFVLFDEFAEITEVQFNNFTLHPMSKPNVYTFAEIELDKLGECAFVPSRVIFGGAEAGSFLLNIGGLDLEGVALELIEPGEDDAYFYLIVPSTQKRMEYSYTIARHLYEPLLAALCGSGAIYELHQGRPKKVKPPKTPVEVVETAFEEADKKMTARQNVDLKVDLNRPSAKLFSVDFI